MKQSTKIVLLLIAMVVFICLSIPLATAATTYPPAGTEYKVPGEITYVSKGDGMYTMFDTNGNNKGDIFGGDIPEQSVKDQISAYTGAGTAQPQTNNAQNAIDNSKIGLLFKQNFDNKVYVYLGQGEWSIDDTSGKTLGYTTTDKLPTELQYQLITKGYGLNPEINAVAKVGQVGSVPSTPAPVQPGLSQTTSQKINDYKKAGDTVEWSDKYKSYIVKDKDGKIVDYLESIDPKIIAKAKLVIGGKDDPYAGQSYIKDGNNWYKCTKTPCDSPDSYEPMSADEGKKMQSAYYTGEYNKAVADRQKELNSLTSILNPSLGAFEVSKIIQGWIGKDVSLMPEKGTWWYDALGYMEAGFETAWCKEKYAPSAYFTEERPGLYVGGGDFPSIDAITIYALGKRTEYVAEGGIDWDTSYKIGGSLPQWFPNILSSVPTTGTTTTTRSSTGKTTTTTLLIKSKSNPGLAAMGYLYKLNWLVKHPKTKEEVVAMSLNDKAAAGFDTDGNITFTIHIKESGAPCMYKNCEQVSPRMYLEPGGQILVTKVQYKLAYLADICIKFDTYKWDGNHMEYPVGCNSPDGIMGKIIKQEVTGSQYGGQTASGSSSGGGGSDWDW